MTANPNSFVIYSRSGENIGLKNKPELIDGHYFVELRPIFESFGYDVLWDETERSATVLKMKQ
ncbi:MAG: stalk domain-containing protein [Caldisericia bacterium]